MSQPPTLKPAARRWAIAVRGIVQGVGFRPFVYNAATSRGLVGWVQNEADTVRIEIQGAKTDLDAFLQALRHSPPPQARIDALEVSELPCQNGSPGVFEIRLSPASGTPRPTIPADLATCSDCLQEIRARASAPPVSVHQLHELRAAVVDHPAVTLRPAAYVDGHVSDVSGLPS